MEGQRNFVFEKTFCLVICLVLLDNSIQIVSALFLAYEVQNGNGNNFKSRILKVAKLVTLFTKGLELLTLHTITSLLIKLLSFQNGFIDEFGHILFKNLFNFTAAVEFTSHFKNSYQLIIQNECRLLWKTFQFTCKLIEKGFRKFTSL